MNIRKYSPVLILVIIIGCIWVVGTADYNFVYLKPISQADAPSYMASCTQPDLQQFFKNPNSFYRQRIKVNGTIVDITENYFDGNTHILLNTRQTESYIEEISISYVEKTHFVEGDNITAYGEGGGTVTYKLSNGKSITLPYLKAVYLQ